ncbi:MAG: hypothetical protein JST75_07270 [Bacteroidetes bacterium]|nr:hypothetical protein [Bacteroidota bacterium]
MFTIIFILSLVIYQYGKIVGYIGCRISEITNSVPQCDCEKFGRDLSNNSALPFQKSTLKERSEDFFTQNFSEAVKKIIPSQSSKITEPDKALAIGYNNAIFQPPRA